MSSEGGGEEDESSLLLRAAEERRCIVKKYERGRCEGAVIDAWEDPEYEIFHVADRFGFIHDKRLPDTSQRSEREKKKIQTEVNRCEKWKEMLRKKEIFFSDGARQREKMINRVYKGVPPSVRGEFWGILLNITKKKDKHKGVYKKMLHEALNYSPDIRQIDLDVNRTYRNNTMFRERYSARQQALFNVLAAYSMFNTTVGYCQGMSQIVALLLMFIVEEEDVFWALESLMSDPKYRMEGFYVQGFPKLLQFQNHHEKILKKFLPKLKKHLDKNGIDTGVYTIKWFFQCFLDRIPFTLALRVWDLFILEGDRVLTAMAYNILRMHRHYLMSYGMDDIMEYLQIKMERNFRFEDEEAITKLRKVMNELRSNRLDSPYQGKPPPTRPESRVDDVRPNSIEREAGLRSRFLTDKEKEFSKHTLQRQIETENRIRREPSLDEGSCDHSLDDTSSLLDECKSEVGIDSSFDTVDDNPRISASRVLTPTSTQSDHKKVPSHSSIVLPPSPLPPSEAQSKLDESLLFMLHAASLNNGLDKESLKYTKRKNASTTVLRSSKSNSNNNNNGGVSKRHSSISFPGTEVVHAAKSSSSSNNNKEDRPKVLSSEGDVVRIHVPYHHRQHSGSTSPRATSSPTRYEGNKVLIPVNSETSTLSNASSRSREISSSSTVITKVSKTSVISSSTSSTSKTLSTKTRTTLNSTR